jgi:acetyl-CoA carboxylase biotin carboxyl carrier protein
LTWRFERFRADGFRSGSRKIGRGGLSTEVEAQITGSVWKIETSVGSEVEEDDVLLIIESMKMEIPVEAPAAGRVEEIRVEPGQAIEEGDVLVVLSD